MEITVLTPSPNKLIRVRGSSNGLTNHPGGDVYRGLLMHAGLLLLLFVVVAPNLL